MSNITWLQPLLIIVVIASSFRFGVKRVKTRSDATAVAVAVAIAGMGLGAMMWFQVLPAFAEFLKEPHADTEAERRLIHDVEMHRTVTIWLVPTLIAVGEAFAAYCWFRAPEGRHKPAKGARRR